MNFSEQIGGYTTLRNSQIIVFNNETIRITLTENGGSEPLILEIRFINDPDGKNDIDSEIEGNTMILKMKNFDESNGVVGIFNPFEIAKSDDGSVIYFVCTLKTYNAKDGNRLFNYSFLTRN